jgi:hypothetical protein
MPGKQMGEFSTKFTSLTLSPGPVGSVLIQGNFEGTATDLGTLVGTASFIGGKSGTYTFCSIAYLDNGESISGTVTGTYDPSGSIAGGRRDLPTRRTATGCSVKERSISPRGRGREKSSKNDFRALHFQTVSGQLARNGGGVEPVSGFPIPTLFTAKRRIVMSLYLYELRLDASTPDKRAQIMERVEQAVKAGGAPAGRLVAGPWASLENPTLFAVFEVSDLNQTMPGTMELYNTNLITDMRMRPIMDWEGAKAAAATAQG